MNIKLTNDPFANIAHLIRREMPVTMRDIKDRAEGMDKRLCLMEGARAIQAPLNHHAMTTEIVYIGKDPVASFIPTSEAIAFWKANETLTAEEIWDAWVEDHPRGKE